MAYKRLGDMLVEAKVISQEELDKALAEQKSSGRRLGEVLIESNYTTEEKIMRALEKQLGVKSVDLIAHPPATDAARYVPAAIARKFQLLPLGISGDVLYIAMLDPLNFLAIENVKKLTNLKVVPMITTQANMEHAFTQMYAAGTAESALQEITSDKSGKRVQSTLAQETRTVITDDPSAAPTIKLVNSILEKAVFERCSDIHFEPRETEMVVRMRIDGSLRQILTVPAEAMNAVISRLKIMGALDIAERRIPQDGRSNIQIGDRKVDLRISTLPTVNGEKMVIRLLDKGAGKFTTDGIGLVGTSKNQFDSLLKNKNGVILITGPTGSGKSSTMYTMIGILNRDDVNLVTLEDPVEFQVNGVNQCQVNEKTNMTFAAGLRSILRQDPDVIVVGEIRDGETANIAMRAAITGHVVLSTLHTNDSVSTIDRLLDMGIEPFMLSSALKGVIAQRLVKRICPRCKKPYHPTPEQCEDVGIPYRNDITFYKGTGCNDCYQTGYKGRTAAFEILVIDNNLRKLISRQEDRDKYMKYLSTTPFLTLSDYCRGLVLNGTTTPEEALNTIYTSAGD